MEEKSSDPDWKKALLYYDWEEGRVITLPQSTYRNRAVVTCYAQGRQTARFRNGFGNYGAYFEKMRPDGTTIPWGTGTVPVLPDGRMIMIIEQRPPQHLYTKGLPTHFQCDGTELRFDRFGPFPSLEFPGGGPDVSGQSVKIAGLQELTSETGVPDQPVELWTRAHAFYPDGADMAHAEHIHVAFLSNLRYDHFVKDDGGLTVLAFTEADVQENIWRGAIVSGQAALHNWQFYHEVKRARTDPEFRTRLETCGYLRVEHLHIRRS